MTEKEKFIQDYVRIMYFDLTKSDPRNDINPTSTFTAIAHRLAEMAWEIHQLKEKGFNKEFDAMEKA